MKKKLISNGIFKNVSRATNGDLIVNINIKITYTNLPNRGLYAIQTFTIYPPEIKYYFKYNTNVKYYIHKYIYNHLLFLADPKMRDFVYEKEEIYDDTSFAIYYRTKFIKSDIQFNSNNTVIIPNYFVMEQEDIGKCEYCDNFVGQNSECEIKCKNIKRKFNPKRICPYWAQEVKNNEDEKKTKKEQIKEK